MRIEYKLSQNYSFLMYTKLINRVEFIFTEVRRHGTGITITEITNEKLDNFKNIKDNFEEVANKKVKELLNVFRHKLEILDIERRGGSNKHSGRPELKGKVKTSVNIPKEVYEYIKNIRKGNSFSKNLEYIIRKEMTK